MSFPLSFLIRAARIHSAQQKLQSAFPGTVSRSRASFRAPRNRSALRTITARAEIPVRAGYTPLLVAALHSSPRAISRRDAKVPRVVRSVNLPREMNVKQGDPSERCKPRMIQLSRVCSADAIGMPAAAMTHRRRPRHFEIRSTTVLLLDE